MKWSLLGWTRSDNPMPLKLSSVPEQQLSVPEQSAAPPTDAADATVAAACDTVTTDVAAEATDIGVSAFRAPLSEATGEDYEAWAYHLAHRNPLARRPGTTIKDEYEQFMVARVRNRPLPLLANGSLEPSKKNQPEAPPENSPESPQVVPVTAVLTAQAPTPPTQAPAQAVLYHIPKPCRRSSGYSPILKAKG
jgi:hypothetical protein